MPDFEFTSPEGKKYRVTGPEGSTKEQAFDVFKQQRPELFLPQASSSQPSEPSGPAEPPSVLQTTYQPAQYAGEAPRRGGVAGAYRAMQQPGFVPPKIETTGDIGEALAQYGKGAGVGLVAGIPGLPGDIEALGRLGLSASGLPISRATALPTSEEVGTAIFGEPETAEERAARTVGSMFGPGIASRVSGRVLGSGIRAAVGTPTQETANLARQAEALGFRLEPGQASPNVPSRSPGTAFTARSNEDLATRLASSQTGAPTTNITPRYIETRLNALGTNYDTIFAGQLQMDSQLANAAYQVAALERSVAPAGSASIARTAENMVGRFLTPQGPIPVAAIDGRQLQRLREFASKTARTAEDGSVRRSAGELVSQIDANLARNNPNMAGLLQETNRQYAATKTLEEGLRKGFVKGGKVSAEGLGEYLASPSAHVYGWGAGTARHPLYPLGYLGRELGIRARFEGAKIEPFLGSDILGGLKRQIGTLALARSQRARAIQRGEPIIPGPPVASTTRAITPPVSTPEE